MIYKNGFILLRFCCGFVAVFSLFSLSLCRQLVIMCVFHNESNYNVVSAFNAH